MNLQSPARPTPRRHFGAIAVTVALVAVCAGWPDTAAAAVSNKALKREARKMSNKAAKLFAQKQFRESAELFEQAYALDPKRLIRIRNAGRAYEEAGDAKKAVHCFQRFLERTDNAKLKKDAAERIKRLSAPVEKPKPAVVAPAPAAAPVVAKKPIEPAPSSPMPLGLAAGGGVLAVVGAVWLVQTLDAESEIDESKYIYEGGATKLEDDRNVIGQNKLVSYGLMGVGVAAAGAGVYMLLSKPDSKSSNSKSSDELKSAAISPLLGRDFRGMSATIRF